MKEIDVQIVLKENSLLKNFPNLFNEWDFEKNNELNINIYEVTRGSGKKVWWRCALKHSYQASVDNRTINGRGCPYCSNRLVWKGYNDMWTSHPEIAKLLLDIEDGYKYTYGSSTKLNWKCPYCNTISKNKLATTVIDNYGMKCKGCKDGISYGEKFIYYIIKSNNLLFNHDITFYWSDNKEYDFYLSGSNVIIEVNGGQHYNETKGTWSENSSLREVQANDKYKEKLASNNGITDYIVIDARESKFEWIKKSVLDSTLSQYVKDINFEAAHEFAQKSFVLMAVELRNKGLSIAEISNELRLAANTIRNYLKRGMKLGIIKQLDSKD